MGNTLITGEVTAFLSLSPIPPSSQASSPRHISELGWGLAGMWFAGSCLVPWLQAWGGAAKGLACFSQDGTTTEM